MSQKQIIIPIYDTQNKDRFRAYYDETRFDIEEYDKAKQSWVPTRKDPDVLFSQIDFKPANFKNLADLLNSIKPEYHKAVSNYDFRKVAALSIIHRSPGLLDILKDAPVIGMLLADSYGKGRITITKASELVYKPRSEILKAIGGTGTKAQVKMLSKIQLSPFTETALSKINKIIGDYSWQYAISKVGLKFIDEDLIDYVSEHEALFDFAVIRNIVESFYGRIPDTWQIKKDWKERILFADCLIWSTINMIRDWPERKRYMNDILKCPSFFDLCNLHFRLDKQFMQNKTRLLANKYGTSAFPPPPIKGNHDFRPIKQIDDLIKEATEMHHCASQYAEEIFEGKYYIYKVMRPERATLGISIEGKEYMEIDQLKLFNNNTPSDETWSAVKNWFESNYSSH